MARRHVHGDIPLCVHVSGAGEVVWPKRAGRRHAEPDQVLEGESLADVSACKCLSRDMRVRHAKTAHALGRVGRDHARQPALKSNQEEEGTRVYVGTSVNRVIYQSDLCVFKVCELVVHVILSSLY